MTGYERRRGLSLLDPSHKKYRPLHESRKYRAKDRRIAKLLSKNNWFKGKQDSTSSTEQMINPYKRDGTEQYGHGRKLSFASSGGSGHQEDDIGQADMGNTTYTGDRSRSGSKLVKKKKKADPPTIGVMFVDQTPEGGLAKKLQAVEDRLAQASGYRIRMVELSGTQLSRLLPNTNPWAGQGCGRNNCYTCNQGDENLEDCKARNILYESKCTLCNPEDVKKKESSRKLGGVQGVYVGESSRSIYEQRSK